MTSRAKKVPVWQQATRWSHLKDGEKARIASGFSYRPLFQGPYSLGEIATPVDFLQGKIEVTKSSHLQPSFLGDQPKKVKHKSGYTFVAGDYRIPLEDPRSVETFR